MSEIIDIKPLEVRDFSGGITDFYLQGTQDRYQYADNFLITVDKQLEMRYGSTFYDRNGNHKMPAPIRRIDKFINYKAVNELLVNQGRDIYYLNTTWTKLTGFSGGESLSVGGSYHSVSTSEWNNHLYLCSDSLGIPSKIYKDENSIFKVKTVGLPQPQSTPVYSTNSLLASCIVLANDIRTQLISHINDSTLHPGFIPGAKDYYSLGYISTAYVNPGYDDVPDPIPTPAPAATNEATLYTLIEALCYAYNHHAFDSYYYHTPKTQYTVNSTDITPPMGPSEKIKSTFTPDNLEDAATTLNELRRKYFFHVFALYTHDLDNTYSAMNVYTVTAPAINTSFTDTAPYITPNYDYFYSYVNALKSIYNDHVSNVSGTIDYHLNTQLTTQYTLCTLPDATDLDSAYLLIYWIWALYGYMHVQDASLAAQTKITFDTTAGSASVTDIQDYTGATYTVPTTMYVYAPGAFGASGEYDSAIITPTGAGTGTLSRNAFATVNNQSAQLTNSSYHIVTLNTQRTFTLADEEQLDPAPEQSLGDTNVILPVTTEEWIERARQVYQAIGNHLNSSYSSYYIHPVQTTLDSMLTNTSLSSFYLPEVETVNYAFNFKDVYNIEGGTEFEVKSSVVYVGSIETAKIYPIGTVLETGLDSGTFTSTFPANVTEVASVTINNLPSITNTTNTNYDTSNIELQIYRTVDAGTTYYLLDSVANGTSTYTDSVSDTLSYGGFNALNTRETIYTTGGYVDTAQPLPCKYLHILDGIALYGYIEDTGQTFPNRIIQAIPGIVEGISPTFYDDLDSKLKGISSTRSNFIAFCENSIYRINGGFTSTGLGSLSHEKIADVLGCISTNSIVQTEVGIFFAGNDGFYYTDGYQVIKISIDLDLTYSRLTESESQRNRISGCYDRANRRIWWSLQSSPNSSDCDISYIYHLNFGIKPSGAFTTASNGTNWNPSAMVFFDNVLLRGDTQGLIFRHERQYLSDPEIPTDITAAIATWKTSYVPFNYTSCALDFGSGFQGQWVTKIHLMGQNFGNVNIQVNSIAENLRSSTNEKSLAPIMYDQNIRWGDATLNWGDADILWQYSGKLDHWRRFTSGTLRSQLKQVKFTPAYVGIYKYDDFPELAYVNVNSTLKTASLLTPTGYTDVIFPLDVVDMYISFESDDYTNEYLITAVADEVITFSDSLNESTTATNQKWVIRGYQKESSINIQSYVLHFATLGMRGRNYPGSTGRGENA